MKLSLLLRKTHKWLGIIIGIQILFWFTGGLVMSVFPIEKVRGNHLVTPTSMTLTSSQPIFTVNEIMKQHGDELVRVSLENSARGLIYRAESANSSTYYNALTGTVLPPLTQDHIDAIAKSVFAGNGSIKASTLINERTTEYKKELPAWKVEFNDSESTILYLSEHTGNVLSVRNSMWRIFDFFWMLHIMDYDERDDFNHPLLIISALIALFLALSGCYLIIKTFRKKDLKWFLLK